jgi:hypothetical protein
MAERTIAEVRITRTVFDDGQIGDEVTAVDGNGDPLLFAESPSLVAIAAVELVERARED